MGTAHMKKKTFQLKSRLPIWRIGSDNNRPTRANGKNEQRIDFLTGLSQFDELEPLIAKFCRSRTIGKSMKILTLQVQKPMRTGQKRMLYWHTRAIRSVESWPTITHWIGKMIHWNGKLRRFARHSFDIERALWWIFQHFSWSCQLFPSTNHEKQTESASE